MKITLSPEPNRLSELKLAAGEKFLAKPLTDNLADQVLTLSGVLPMKRGIKPFTLGCAENRIVAADSEGALGRADGSPEDCPG